MAAKHHKLAVYDELIGHLEGILFQIPVISFIDRHCLIFEPDVDDNPEYKKVWEQYKTMVAQLLEGFREDCGLTHEQIIQTLKQIDKEIDLEDKSIFEQMFATESYKVFVSMMARKNTELQQQVILVILSQTGSVPDICVPGDVDDFKKKKTTEKKEPSGCTGSVMINEDAILAAVLKKSKEEYEAQQARQKKNNDADVEKVLQLSKQEAPKLQQQHQAQQEKLTQDLRECAHDDPPLPGRQAASTPKPKETTKAKPRSKTSVIADVHEIKNDLEQLAGPGYSSPKIKQQTFDEMNDTLEAPSGVKKETSLEQKATVIETKTAAVEAMAARSQTAIESDTDVSPTYSPLTTGEAMQDLTLGSSKQVTKSGKKPETEKSSSPAAKPAAKAPAIKITNEQAAANWLAGAMSDVDKAGVKNMAEGYSKMSQEELKQRQTFLKEQRDKLLKMKQEERESRYLKAEKAASCRPMSARAGRSAMKSDSAAPAVDQKTLDMRKAIANRLKEEVIALEEGI
ncbi:cilia- and flagella-associated protein 36-like isoform X1 [Lineus longissimus]|uniref:cilia- and flagella-associated protein 36-like isoform X1 n=1 Tax=Lineus longissimus TaxID=88925 RepID=UPI00315CB6EA